jgi:hypothetical protein
MKSKILCFLAGVCFLFVLACDSAKTGPPKKFEELDPKAESKSLEPPKPPAPPSKGPK